MSAYYNFVACCSKFTQLHKVLPTLSQRTTSKKSKIFSKTCIRTWTELIPLSQRIFKASIQTDRKRNLSCFRIKTMIGWLYIFRTTTTIYLRWIFVAYLPVIAVSKKRSIIMCLKISKLEAAKNQGMTLTLLLMWKN